MTIQQHASFDSSAAELNATSKLVKAWESKNAKNAAKAGGVSLMALSLAACGGSSETVDITSDNAAAIATALTDANGTLHADVAAAIASGVDSVDITSDNAAAVTGALTGADGTVYADVAAAIAAGVTSVDITTDNATAITGALTGADGTVYADVAAAIAAGVTSVDITSDNATAATTALRNAAAELGVTGTSTMTDAELITAIKTANDTAIANGVDLTTDNATAINSAVAAATTFTNLDDLVEAYEAAIAPAEVLNYVLAATADVISGGDSATVISGTAGTIDGDNINGGGGADTLNLTVTVADDDNAAFTTTSVETISIRSTGGTANDAAFVDLNFADASGVETLQLRRLGDDVEIDDLGDLSTTIELNNVATAADVNINYDAATVAGDSDTVNVTIASSTGGGDLVINDVETIAVTVTGEDNDMNIDGDSIDSVTIGGAGDLNVDFDASVTTANASANTGGVTMNATAAADVTFTGGTGADTFAMGATLTAADTLAGGDGADTLTVTGAGGALIPTSAAITGVETLTATINGVDTLDANVASFDNINILSTAATDDVTITDLTSEVLTLTQTAAGNDIDEVDVSLADATATDDALTVNVTNAHTTTVFNVDLIESTGGGIETLTVNLNQGVDLADADDIQIDVITAGTALTVTGDADAELGAGTALTQTVVNAATATGDLTINVGAAASTVTGGTGADTIAMGANLTTTDTVAGGDGDDTLSATLASGTVAATITGVETASLVFGDGDETFSGSNTTGLATIVIADASDDNVSLAALNASTTTIQIASDDSDGNSTVTVDYAANTSAAHTILIGEVAEGADNLLAGNVTVTDNTGTLTVTDTADSTVNAISNLTANDALGLVVTTVAGTLELDAGAEGAGNLSATSATSVTFTTEAALLVDGTTDISAATSIVYDANAGTMVFTGATDATAATSVTINAESDVTFTGDFLSAADVTTFDITANDAVVDFTGTTDALNLDNVATVNMTAITGGTVTVDDIEATGTNAAGTNIVLTVNMSATGEDAAGNGSTVTLSDLSSDAAATFDAINVTTDADGTASLTVNDDDTTITSIDASASAGDFTLALTDSAAAVSIELGSGTNDLTLEADLAHTVEFASGAGTDTINMGATTAAVVIDNFEAGADGDIVSIDVSAIGGAGGAQNANSEDLTSALVVSFATDDDGVLVNADNTMVATDNVLVITDTYADVAAMTAAIDLDDETNVGGLLDNDVFLVLWTDGADSYISTVDFDAADGAGADGGTNLVQLSGVTVTDLTADNIAFI